MQVQALALFGRNAKKCFKSIRTRPLSSPPTPIRIDTVNGFSTTTKGDLKRYIFHALVYTCLISDTQVGSLTDEGYIPIKIKTVFANKEDDYTECRHYKTGFGGCNAAVVFVGGVGGGWDGPAKGLYPRLSQRLVRDHGISALRIRFRHPTNLEECVIDARAGIEFLTRMEMKTSIGLVGHSFGGAVVISSAALSKDIVKTVVTLSTQSYGTEGISKLKENKCSVLLIHGNSDSVLSSYCSSYIYNKAKEPKRLILYDDASHSLDEVADKVFRKVQKWLVENLAER
jgi:pimeloyl-ACP methyl ester carboxylesterase